MVIMYVHVVLKSLLLLFVLSRRTHVRAATNDLKKLKLLTLVPFFDPKPDAGWDKGLEILPMGRIARDEINQREDILPGYELELIEASSDACSYSVISTALVNFAGNAIGLNGDSNVVGVVGLACSTVTANVSPVAGREGVSLIQMSMSNSPDLRNSDKYPHLWRTLSSSIIFVNATLALMDLFEWSKISTLYDENGNYFKTTSRTLVDEIMKNEEQSVILDIAIDDTEEYINSAVDQITSNGARIIFVSATPLEAAVIMCAAARKDLVSPGYQWIFHTRKLGDFESDAEKTECGREQLLAAMEGVVLIQWQIAPDDFNTTVYSGKSFQELRTLYSEELKDLIHEDQYKQYANEFRCEEQEYTNEFRCEEQEYAYPLYDEIWALTLALNNSLPELEEMNFSLTNYQFGNKLVTEIIEKHLSAVSFRGIAGQISFDIHHEALTSVQLYQVRNGTEVLVGHYSKLEGLVIYNSSDFVLPDDEFPEEHLQVPQALRITLYIISSLLIIMITSLLLLTIFYHRSPIIKATSALLSTLIFFGCYFISFSAVANSLLLETEMTPSYYTGLCNTHLWLWTVGMSLILGTNLVKLGRIYRIFTHFGQTGWSLSDNALFLYVLILGLVPAALMLAWSVADTPRYHLLNFTHFYDNRPVVEFVTTCSSQYFTFWLLSLLAYFGVMLVAIMFLAFSTRKIKNDYFKDTKKIMFFVFFLTITWIVTISTRIILLEIAEDYEQYGSVVLVIGKVVFCLLCMSFMLAPKVLPVFYQHVTTGHYKVATARRRSTLKLRRRTTLDKLIGSLNNIYV